MKVCIIKGAVFEDSNPNSNDIVGDSPFSLKTIGLPGITELLIKDKRK